MIALAIIGISAFLMLRFEAQSEHYASVIGLRLAAGDCGEVAADTAWKLRVPGAVDTNFSYPVAASRRRFIDQNGNVYLLKTMSSWAMAQRCSNATITHALEGLKSLGFNAITVAPFGVHLNNSFGDRYQNGSGQRFFIGAPFASDFGPAWASMDWTVEEATRLRMTVVLSLFLSWGDSGTTLDLLRAGPDNAYKYGKSLAVRYTRYPNIVWHVMGDFVWSAGDAAGRQVDAVFHGLKDGEGGSHRLIIAEQQRGPTGYQQFIQSEGGEGGYQWFKQSANGLYDYGSNSVEVFDAVYGERGAERYGVVDIEPPYVNSPHYSGNKDQQYRERNYAVFLRGGIGINFGHEKWWPFGAAGIYDGGRHWFEILGDPPLRQAKYAWSLIDKYVADPAWARDDGRFVRVGIGDGDAKAASGYSNVAALAYFPTGRSVTVRTTVISGATSVKLSWYDPTTGEYSLISKSELPIENRTIAFPASHPDGSDDWILVVERA